MYSMLTMIMAERFRWGVPPQNGRDDALFVYWLPLSGGFGLWLSANVVYLRAMVSVHIFVKIPRQALIMILVGLIPWLGICATGSYIGTIAVCLLSMLYVFMLLSQLWPIRKDLTDAFPHAIFCGKKTEKLPTADQSM